MALSSEAFVGAGAPCVGGALRAAAPSQACALNPKPTVDATTSESWLNVSAAAALSCAGAAALAAGSRRRSRRGVKSAQVVAVQAAKKTGNFCFYEQNGSLVKFPSEEGDLFEMDTSKTLGVGAQGKVHPGRNVKTGEEVAVKFMPVKHLILDEAGAAKIQLIDDEMTVMKSVGRHPNIAGAIAGVSVYRPGTTDYCHSKNLVMEIVRGRELAEAVAAEGAFAENVAHHVFKGILAGLQHMHKQGILHRDLKAANVMVTGDKVTTSSEVKLIDFGVAKPYDGKPFATLVGTLEIMPPEVAKAKISYLPPGAERKVHTAKFKSPQAENPGFGFVQLTQDGFGARITNVEPNGQADKQGVANDWVLTKINDTNVEKMLFQANADDSSHAKVPKIVNTLMSIETDFTLEMVEMPTREFSAKVDTWAAGVVLYTMLTGKAPFFKELDIIESDYVTGPLEKCSAEAKSLLAGLLEKDPDKRLSLDQALAHPWMQCAPSGGCAV